MMKLSSGKDTVLLRKELRMFMMSMGLKNIKKNG